MANDAAQNPTGTPTEWQAEKARLEASLQAVANERNAYRQKAQAWENNVGKELGDVVELDGNGLPLRVNYGEPRPAYTGTHPLVAAGIDPAVAQQYDAYMMQQVSSQFVTPQQLQAQVNAARQEAFLASTSRFETLRNVDHTVTDARYKELGDMSSPLSKKTEEVLNRNGWGAKSNPTGKSWEDFQYAAPNALSIAAQIAKAELFESTQSQAGANAQAQAAQAAAGIVSSGGGSAGSPAPSTAEMTKMFSTDPLKAEEIARQQFELKTGVTLRH